MSPGLERKNRWRRLGWANSRPRLESRSGFIEKCPQPGALRGTSSASAFEVAGLLEQRSRLSMLLLQYEERLKDANEDLIVAGSRNSEEAASLLNSLHDKVLDLSAKVAFDEKARRAVAHIIWNTIQRQRMARTAAKLRKKPLFHEEWYTRSYLGSHRRDADAAMDYVSNGFWRGNFPNPLFDTRYYLRQNADVLMSGINPLLHYTERGWREGRDPNEFFSITWYLSQYPDVRDRHIDPLQHYIEFGAAERRDPGPAFSTARYLDSHPEIESAGLNPLVHFLHSGRMSA